MVATGILLFYIIFRIGCDSFWQQFSVYYSYAFEAAFVAAVGFYYRNELKWKIDIKPNLMPFVWSLAGGFSVFKIAGLSGITIPFDLSSSETIFLLLILAPILEELIFRMALWQPLEHVLKKP